MSESTEGIVCPHCNYTHYYGDFPDLITYWGDELAESAKRIECEDCGKPFRCEEQVTRTWVCSTIAEESADG